MGEGNSFDNNLVKAFNECAEEYGVSFTAKEYKEFSSQKTYAPGLHKIFSFSKFNKVKKLLFGKESLNKIEVNNIKIKKDYKKVCDKAGNIPLNISEYGRRKEEDMISPHTIRNKTTSDILKNWYKQKKKDDLFGTNKAKFIALERQDGFNEFCKNCVNSIENCGYDSETCPYWKENKSE